MTDLAIPSAANLLPAPAYSAVDWELTPSTLARIQRAPAANTLTAYRRWIEDFRAWCESTGRNPLPATPQTLANYVDHLADRDKGIPTIRIAVAAVRFVHEGAGYSGQPAGKLAELVRRAHSRDRIGADNRLGQATPIELDALRKMVDTCSADSLRGRRDRLVLVLGWSGMLRRSELAALMFGDITEGADGIKVYIASSKTDQDGKGATVLIPSGVHEGTDPTRVWRAYVDAMATLGITSGPLLRSIGKGGKVADRITGYAVNSLVRQAATRAELKGAKGYRAHSLRAGGATAAYLAGAPVAEIAEHGRWAKNSPVVLGYIRAADKWRNNPMRGVGL